jgi:hypothetical protein
MKMVLSIPEHDGRDRMKMKRKDSKRAKKTCGKARFFSFHFSRFIFMLTFAPAFGMGRCQDAEFPVMPMLDRQQQFKPIQNNG